MMLFVHSSGRSGKQTTLDFLRPLKEDIILVVQKREARLYERWRSRVFEILVLPENITTLSPTRQFILEFAHDAKLEKICLLDDDLRFFKRKPPTANTKANHSLLNATPEEVVEMFALLERWLDLVVHCSLSAREGNDRVLKDWTEPGRAMRCLAYHVPTLMKIGARFDRIPAKQDMDMTLQLLRAGYVNRISWLFAQGQAANSGAKGGCSVYRDKKMLTDCANKLAALHPGFVKVVEKKTKGSFGGGTRTDVVIYWKRAWESSMEMAHV